MSGRSRHARLAAYAIAAAKTTGEGVHARGWSVRALWYAGASLGSQVVRRPDSRPGQNAQHYAGPRPGGALQRTWREAAAVLARLWREEEPVPSPRKTRSPRFCEFAERYRERRLPHLRWPAAWSLTARVHRHLRSPRRYRVAGRSRPGRGRRRPRHELSGRTFAAAGSRGRSGGHVCQSVGRSLTHAKRRRIPSHSRSAET